MSLVNIIADGAAVELARVKTLPGLLEMVGFYGRRLVKADGATVVLRRGTNCYYAEEDAIAPLWKGRSFPETSCISGWVMMNGKSAMIEDVFADPRIPSDLYRPTFVKSLAMVPVGKAPLAALGVYWATRRLLSSEQLQLLEELAVRAGQAISLIG